MIISLNAAYNKKNIVSDTSCRLNHNIYIYIYIHIFCVQ